jgi:hypothetical protein
VPSDSPELEAGFELLHPEVLPFIGLAQKRVPLKATEGFADTTKLLCNIGALFP